MNEIFFSLGIENWKPVLASLMLPPVPFVVLVLVGARLMFKRRLTAWLLILLGAAGMWMSATPAAGRALTFWLLQPPLALGESQIAELKRAPKTAIVVLGGGRRSLAPEYGVAMLKARTVERLRYGLWLSRETGLPVAFSGGVGRGSEPGPTEAEIAGRLADKEFGRPLRWLESESRDTRENATRTLALLQPAGIEQVVIVTHGYHMARSLKNFQRAGEGLKFKFVVAPMGLPSGGRYRWEDFLPSVEGFESTWIALHEWLGLVSGA